MMARAAGKAMIAGEYAVLFGSQALVAAINRYALCSFQSGPSEDRTDPLFVAAKESAIAFGYPPQKGCYSIDTVSFYSLKTRRKLGLGSSAAAISALCKLILLQHEAFDQELWFKMALKAHQRFSAGLGSGVDVAASIFGGLVSFKRDERPKSLSMPELWDDLVFIDTMQSQDTRDFIAAVMDLKSSEPKFIDSFVDRSDLLVNRFIDQKELSQRVIIFDELFGLLRSLGQRAGIDIISPQHEAIHRAAKKVGGSAKPSGAGGGDFALALIPKARRREFSEEMSRLGFAILELENEQ